MSINYFESEYIKILLFNNKFKDKFLINVIDNKISIERIDSRIGWGQNLDIIVRDKILGINNIINIGNSDENIKTIEYIIKDHNLTYHYETEFYKIFYISEQFNDIFKIIYNEVTNLISIQRVDADEGWGQNLKLKYIEKNYPFKEKIINIGPSKSNITTLKINLNEIKYIDKYNYYESENYKINLHEIKYSDLFLINFYEETMTIYIKRIDSNKGWGQHLKLDIIDIKQNKVYTIYIGKSIKNDIYIKIDISMKKYYIGLTTIPSRIKLPIFKENIEELLKYECIENIFITIAKKYKRFEETISHEIISYLQSIPKIIIILLEEDYGPASKYLGPLIHYQTILQNNILIIVDDDRRYNKNLINHFKIAYDSYPNIIFSSGMWSDYFNKKYKNITDNNLEIELYKEDNNNKFFYGQGVGGFFGFAIKIVDNMDKFISYNFKIMERIPKSIYHDEGIILGYLKYKCETIMYLKHKGCEIYKNELVDALCTSNLVDRGKIEKEILQITNLEKIL